MGLMAISALIFLLAGVGVAIVLTSFILLLIFCFIATGILSASVMAGLNKKSFSAGFRIFVFSSGCIFGTLAGTGFFLLLHKVSHWWTLAEALLAGSLTGLAVGYLMSMIVFYIVRKLSGFLKEKVNR